MIFDNPTELKDRIESCAKRKVFGSVKIREDTTQYMSLLGGDVLRIAGNDYFILGDAYEGRFGINDQPKFWVKQAVNLEDGTRKIIKLVYFEDFIMQMGKLKIRGTRSPEKESSVLEKMAGHPNFMQGKTVFDVTGNCVRIVDFIRGNTLFSTILDNEKKHPDYFREDLFSILTNILDCIKAIAFLAQCGEHHGDIRNDHVIIEKDTGVFKWIDFDLSVNFSDYDLWSLGNLLIFSVGKGIRPILSSSLSKSSLNRNSRMNTPSVLLRTTAWSPASKWNFDPIRGLLDVLTKHSHLKLPILSLFPNCCRLPATERHDRAGVMV